MADKPIWHFLIPILFTLSPVMAHAQVQNLDSLRQIIDAYVQTNLQEKDTALLTMLEAVCVQYSIDFELDSLQKMANKGLELSAKMSELSPSSEWKKRLDHYQTRFFSHRGNALIRSGDYVNALKDFQQQLMFAEKTGFVKEIGTAYNSIAFCHQNLEDYNLAYAYALKVHNLLKDSPHKSVLARSNIIISEYYVQIKSDIDSAAYFCKEAIKLYHADKNYLHETKATFSLLEYLADGFQTDSSLYYLKKIEPFVLSRQTPDLMIRYHTAMGKALYEKGRIKEALTNLLLAKEDTKEVNTPQAIYNVHRYLSLALAASGQRIASLEAMEVAISAYGEDIDTEKAREITAAQLNFDFEKKEALAKLELQRQQRIRDISLLGLGLGLLVALLLFRLYRQSKKTARLLAEKNTQIEQSYRDLKETQAQLVLTEKQREAQSVRVNIARDIHDELGAGLTKITMMSEFLRKKLTGQPEETATMLQRIAEYSKGVSTNLSEIVWAVSPGYDTLESLSAYLKNYAAHYLEGTGIEGKFDFPTDLPAVAVNPALKRNVFLVLKEALNNVAKYADASSVDVAFAVENGMFQLTITDDGKGFDPQQATPANGAGNGLVNMKTRMEQSGCTWELKTAPGAGCTVRAFGPIHG
jgi:signal transduction histidine kinase